MGYGTIAAFNNDLLSEMREPGYGEKLYLDILGFNNRDKRGRSEQRVGEVVHQAHGDNSAVIFFPHMAYGRVLDSHFTPGSHLPDDEAILRQLADKLGYSLRKKKK